MSKRMPHAQGCLANTHRAIIKYGRPDDVIVTVDGDDWLAHEDVLTIINAHYERDGCWVLYGGAIWKPADRRTYESALFGRGNRQPAHTAGSSGEISPLQLESKCSADVPLRLYQQIGVLDPDWSCLKDGDGCFYEMAADVAIMLPLIEFAGEQRTQHNRSQVYVYNLHEQNEHERDRPEQLRITWEIFAKPSFPRLETLDTIATRQSLAPAFVPHPRKQR